MTLELKVKDKYTIRRTLFSILIRMFIFCTMVIYGV